MMLSRMADALYWMARNLERADNVSRLMEINLIHLVEAEEATPEEKSVSVGEAPPPRVRAPGEAKPKKKRAKVKVPPPPKEV